MIVQGQLPDVIIDHFRTTLQQRESEAMDFASSIGQKSSVNISPVDLEAYLAGLTERIVSGTVKCPGLYVESIAEYHLRKTTSELTT